MTIRPGEDWGCEVDCPVGEWISGGDLELSRHVASGSPLPFALTAGSLLRVLGRPRSAVGSLRCRRLTVDMMRVHVDGHSPGLWDGYGCTVTVRRSLFRGGMLAGEVKVLSNCGEVFGLGFARRGHPNDSRVEMLHVVGGSIRQRLVAYSRLRSGLFESSADIRVTQTDSGSIEIPHGYVLLVDGRRITKAEKVTVVVEPDRATVYVGID